MKFINDLINIIKYKEKQEYNFVLPSSDSIQDSQISNTSQELTPLENITENVYSSLDSNLEYINVKYNTLINSDIKIRKFKIMINNEQYSAFLLYIDGLINSLSINEFVIEPLMNNAPQKTTPSMENFSIKLKKKFNLAEYISECLVPQNDVICSNEFKKIFSQVNLGITALFVDTVNLSFLIDAKGFEKRSISPPKNEIIIRGSQESFIESIRTNTSLLRKIINNENLVIENLNVRHNY